MPVAAPTASNAEMMPMLPGTLDGLISSRTMPKVNGTTAPAKPWKIRAAINSSIVGDTAARTVPNAKMVNEMSMIRDRPNMSPSRPMIGVATDDDNKNPVTSHVVAIALASRSR